MTVSNRDYQAIADGYRDAVLDGTIPACVQVKQMMERQLKDIARQESDSSFPYRWQPEVCGLRACSFVEEFRHVKGKWAGQRFEMAPWQVFFTLTLFGWVHKPSGMRRFREMFLLVPRKNGKTFWAATIGLFGLLADKEAGAEIYCGANSKDQAMQVFRPAQQMIRNDAELRDYYGVEVFASNINVAKTASKFEPEIKNVRDGASPHFAICDELHEADTPHMVDAFSTGMGARTQPLLIIISTAGVNLGGPCFERQKSLEKVLDGSMQNDLLFGTVYTVDKEDDWQDHAAWVKANPNYGVSVLPEFIEGKIIETKNHLSRRNINLCKHLNIWNSASAAFFDMQAWNRCADTGLSLDSFAGMSCYVGLDLASKVDVAAMVILFPSGGSYYAFGKYYLPMDTINKPENTHYQGWHYEQRITATEGPIIDFGVIEEDIKAMASRFDVLEVAYDPFQATQLSTRLTADGFPMVEMRPTILNFSEPMKELAGMTLSGVFRHDGCPIMAWMASNVVSYVDSKDNVYPRKQREQNKIDGIVALLMALGRAMAGASTGKSVYEGRGCLTV